MDLIDMAWNVVEHWIKTDYNNNRDAAVSELGNLDECVMRVADCIEMNELADDFGDIILLSSNVELAGY